LIFKTIIAACVGWGALYAAQHYWLASMMAQIAENSGLQLMPPAPVFPTIEINPGKLRQAINPPVRIDTRAAERAAIESMSRQIDLQNRAALSRVPLPPSIPGLPHH
jgi:hypothetical protein